MNRTDAHEKHSTTIRCEKLWMLRTTNTTFRLNWNCIFIWKDIEHLFLHSTHLLKREKKLSKSWHLFVRALYSPFWPVSTSTFDTFFCYLWATDNSLSAGRAEYSGFFFSLCGRTVSRILHGPPNKKENCCNQFNITIKSHPTESNEYSYKRTQTKIENVLRICG